MLCLWYLLSGNLQGVILSYPTLGCLACGVEKNHMDAPLKTWKSFKKLL